MLLERDLESVIFNTPNHILRSKGLHIDGLKRKQVDLKEFGRADLITHDRRPINSRVLITLFELKCDEINLNTLVFFKSILIKSFNFHDKFA